MATAEFTAEEIANEEWRPVPGMGGIYSVSDLGRVRRDGRHMMSGTVSPKGYISVHLSAGGIPATWRLARLVMAAFAGPSDLTVNHIDGDKRNNRLANLEYLTQAENVAHAVRTGLKKYAPPGRRRNGVLRGEQNSSHKLTELQAIEAIRMRADGQHYRAIGKHFGVTPQAIYLIAKSKNWAHLRSSTSLPQR